MEKKYTVYYYCCIIAFVIPIISYIIFPGVDVIPSLIKAFFILYLYNRMKKINKVNRINLNWAGRTLAVFIAISALFSLTFISIVRLFVALLITELFSWSVLLVSLMVTDIYSIKYILKAYFIILVPCAIFSALFWDGFFTFDPPHVLTPLTLCMLISLFAPVKVRILFAGALVAGVIYDYSVRSCLLTFLVTSLIYIGYSLCSDRLKLNFLALSRKTLFLLPIFFLFLALFRNYNIFEAIENQDISTIPLTNGRKSEGHLMNTDSRTLVYVDVINASKNLSDVIMGHGPVINLESYWMSNRHSVEAGILNIYLRYGLIGCLLFLIFIYKVSHNGMYNTNNDLTRLASVYVAYKFLLMFMDDPSLEGSMFIAIGICLSPSIRQLSNNEIRNALSKTKII